MALPGWPPTWRPWSRCCIGPSAWKRKTVCANHVIATAEKGSKLAAVAEVGDFVRVKIGKELFGYVNAKAVGPASGGVVARMLAVDPQDRYVAPSALLADLEAVTARVRA